MNRLAVPFAFAVILYVASPVAQAFATSHVRPPGAALRHPIPADTELTSGEYAAWTATVDWKFWVPLIIAALGGVPGIIGIINLYKRSSIKIDFDHKNSVACIIDAKTNLNNKFAVLLYRIRITGKGAQPSYIAEILVAVRKEKQWVQGKRFIPSQSDKTDPDGVTKRAVHLRFERPRGETDNIYIASWNDFAPGQAGLKYGEPVIFSAGFYFDREGQDFKKISKLKIIVTDYLGNKYKKIFDAGLMMKNYPKIYLGQD